MRLEVGGSSWVRLECLVTSLESPVAGDANKPCARRPPGDAAWEVSVSDDGGTKKRGRGEYERV